MMDERTKREKEKAKRCKGYTRRFVSFSSRTTIALLFLSCFFLNIKVFLTLFTDVLPWHDINAFVSFTNEESSSPLRVDENRTNGVFVIKVKEAEHAEMTLCSLTHFFNKGPKYPVRIFADFDCTEEAQENLQSIGSGADVRVIVDTKRWYSLPSTLTAEEQSRVRKKCTNLDRPMHAKCTEMNVFIGYVFMGYWRYSIMADEPSLQEFEYFVSIDADAFLTKDIPDPFLILKTNNLTGFFNKESRQQGRISYGIQESVEKIFSLEERQNRYLDSPQYLFFKEDGKWLRKGLTKPSFHGSFYGGRLDFFRQETYRKFAQLMAPYTYEYRTDEQGVISVAWSLMGDKVWYLPKRGYSMGVYHHGWIDDQRFDRIPGDNSFARDANYTLWTLDNIKDFQGNWDGAMQWNSYGPTVDNSSNWTKCLHLRGKYKFRFRNSTFKIT